MWFIVLSQEDTIFNLPMIIKTSKNNHHIQLIYQLEVAATLQSTPQLMASTFVFGNCRGEELYVPHGVQISGWISEYPNHKNNLPYMDS